MTGSQKVLAVIGGLLLVGAFVVAGLPWLIPSLDKRQEDTALWVSTAAFVTAAVVFFYMWLKMRGIDDLDDDDDEYDVNI